LINRTYTAGMATFDRINRSLQLLPTKKLDLQVAARSSTRSTQTILRSIFSQPRPLVIVGGAK
jgi:hypothetical protein